MNIYLSKLCVCCSLIKAKFNLIGKEIVWSIKTENQKERKHFFTSHVYKSGYWTEGLSQTHRADWPCTMRKSDTRDDREQMKGWAPRICWEVILGMRVSPKIALRPRLWKTVPILWLSTGCCVSMNQIPGILRINDTGRIFWLANHLFLILCPEDCVT